MEYQVEGDSFSFLVMSILQTNKLLQIINRNLIMNAIMRAMKNKFFARSDKLTWAK